MTDQRQAGSNSASWLGRGAVGGIVAGAVFLAVTMWFATSVGDPAKGPLLMISTIVKGDDAMMTGSTSAGVGLAVHVGLSALFGVVFALLASRLKSNGALAFAGTLYGAALYLVNFKILSPIAFPVFEDGQPALRAGRAHRLRDVAGPCLVHPAVDGGGSGALRHSRRERRRPRCGTSASALTGGAASEPWPALSGHRLVTDVAPPDDGIRRSGTVRPGLRSCA
ncbi:MAG: hypothetical protein M3N32_01865 [Actinomycetota bacterium]|nr:hypothetical protein [Actinomycetota bacterium]